jgi:DNA polymerase-3 subunit delta'
MLFSEVINQKKTRKQLISAARNNRIPHAQLFLGPEGSGKLALALAFAQYVNCQEPGEQDACGECASCRKAQRLVHPDIHFSCLLYIYPSP